MKIFQRLCFLLIILFTFLFQTLEAKERMEGPYSASEEDPHEEAGTSIEKKVTEALDAVIQKRNKKRQSHLSDQRKVEIIYPPHSLSKKEEGRIKEASRLQDNLHISEQDEKKHKPIEKKYEIVVNGKSYQSIKEYKKERLKNVLKDSFFQANLAVDAFSDEELMAIIKDIQKSQEIAKHDSVSDMKKMMEIYNRRSGTDKPLSIDLNRMKTIIVEPKE